MINANNSAALKELSPGGKHTTSATADVNPLACTSCPAQDWGLGKAWPHNGMTALGCCLEVSFSCISFSGIMIPVPGLKKRNTTTAGVVPKHCRHSAKVYGEIYDYSQF